MARVILLTDLSEEYAKLLLKGIVQYSQEHEPWIVCKMPPSYRDVLGIESVLDWALKWKADAIIGQFYATDNVKIFKEHGILAIAQDFKSRFTEIPNITGDHFRAGRMGADYFIQRGFKKFAFYGFSEIIWSQERNEGFQIELGEQGFSGHFHEYQNVDFKELWYYESDLLIEWLKQLPKPIGIMVCDDNQGHHISELCRQYDIRVPEDISILGVDNDEAICTLSYPPLSSVNQAVEKGGYETAVLIDKWLANPTAPIQDVVVHPTHIVTRESTDIYATDDKHISTVLKYIHLNTDKKLNVPDIAKLVPLSRRLLENKFKAVTGQSIYSYILDLRIEKFGQKLLESNAPIVEIAMEMDFSDYKNIPRQFKNIKGCTPSEYRLQYSIKK